MSFNKRPWSLQDFEIARVVGHGRFGRVYLARERKSGFIVALKVIPRKDLQENPLTARQVLAEIDIQSVCSHNNILELFGYFHDDKNIYLIIEYCTNGTLNDVLQEKIRLPEKEASKNIESVLRSIDYLHRRKIIHRDIKTENILLSHNGTLKLADFGWSVKLTTEKKRRETFCGTLDYIAPEIVERLEYGRKVDIWACGILLWEMLFGDAPFIDVDEISTMRRIREIDYEFPLKIPVSDECKDFISRIFHINPLKRPKAEELLRHPFILKFKKTHQQKRPSLGRRRGLSGKK
ncbi:hypothetical protein PCE1_002148 [Barthelona sp. PCE]